MLHFNLFLLLIFEELSAHLGLCRLKLDYINEYSFILRSGGWRNGDITE